jgi:hypothetical protein
MARPKRGGRLTTSATPPQLFSQQRKNSTETKYFGLVRDNALLDLTSPDAALDEVLTDIQDPAEAATLGIFVANDLQIIDAALRFDLKKEDFEILLNSSINAEDAETGRLVPFINPRQRISDRIKQFEGFAGRGTVYQGQGTTLFKYVVPDTQYNHTNPPPFYTEPLDSTVENAPDFIPSTEQEIENSHRIGFIENGQFVPAQDPEWWWNGEYNHEFRDRAVYGLESQTALDNPSYPIVRDGNLQFSVIFPEGINSTYNWGLRFDTWFKKDDFGNDQNFLRWVAQVNGHVRIDYFDRTGYDSEGAVQGAWKVALDTTDSSTYYTQLGKEDPVQSIIGSRLYYLQGGPAMPLGQGTGTLPAQRTPANGGALDLNATFLDREGNSRDRFANDYVPVVIRFWYGRPDPSQSDPVLAGPVGKASIVLGATDSSISGANLPLWNDYSAQIRVVYDDALNSWKAEAPEEDFENFTNTFEILAHDLVGANPAQPSSVANYIVPDGQPIIASKITAPNEDVLAQFSIPGITASNGQKIWVIAKNRPWETLPSGNRVRTSLWQRYLFHPNPIGTYKTSRDLLEGVGENYVEPEPLYSLFEDNPNYYKAKYGKLPSLSTYGPDRYDGMLPNTLRESSTARDYDYSHENLLLVGRQKKDENEEPLATNEVRKNAENYTFIEVVRNAAGRGGNVTINAYPTNNLSVQSTTVNNAPLGKFLHMGDNQKTFTNPLRQNVSSLGVSVLPSNANFPATNRIRYEEIGGSGRLVYGGWDGTTFTPDATGIIAQLSMGTGGARSHGTKSAFLTDFTTVAGVKHSFYGTIGVVRSSFEGQVLTVESNGTSISSQELFPNGGETSNNSQYIGTEIIFGGSATIHRVTSYAASSSTVTFTPSKTAGAYPNSEVWYNHFSLGGVLPSRAVNSETNADVSRASVLGVNGFTQISFVFNQAYQFTRADNGAGLSFGEVLYAREALSATPSSPFVSDSELPAPPADIVVPFGYDNTPSALEPGLGGLCYPPYSIQNISLQPLGISDVNLYDPSTPQGNFDTWWGSRQTPLDLGGKSLTITSKLLFDFDPADRPNLLSTLSQEQDKRFFNGSEYTHKLEIELNVELPTPPSQNIYIFEDVKSHSNNKPVKDKYYLFINNNNGELEVLSPANPAW